MTTKMKENLIRSKKVEYLAYISLISVVILLILTQEVQAMKCLQPVAIIICIIVLLLSGTLFAMKRKEKYIYNNKIVYVVLSDILIVGIWLSSSLIILLEKICSLLEKTNYQYSIWLICLVLTLVTVRLTEGITTYFSNKLSKKV